MPVEPSIAAMRAAFAAGAGEQLLTVRVVEGGDHGLRVPGGKGPRGLPAGLPGGAEGEE